MSVTALTTSHTEPRAHLAERSAAVRTEETNRLKQATHHDDTPPEPVRAVSAARSSGMGSALVSLKKGG